VEFVQSVGVGASIVVTGVSRHDRTLVPLFHSRMEPSANSSKSGAPSSGLLSNVFGFFSREIESFVVNAAGGSVQASHAKHDHAQVRRRTLIHVSQQSAEPGPSGSSHKPKRVKKKSRRVNDAEYSKPPDTKRDKTLRRDERGRRRTTNERSRRSDESKPGELGSPYFQAIYLIRIFSCAVFLKPSSPVPPKKASLKPPPITMPGSLFPRSPSMLPDFAPVLQTPRIQHISNDAPPPAPERSDPIRAQVHPMLDDHHAEADVSSGALSQ